MRGGGLGLHHGQDVLGGAVSLAVLGLGGARWGRQHSGGRGRSALPCSQATEGIESQPTEQALGLTSSGSGIGISPNMAIHVAVQCFSLPSIAYLEDEARCVDDGEVGAVRVPAAAGWSMSAVRILLAATPVPSHSLDLHHDGLGRDCGAPQLAQVVLGASGDGIGHRGLGLGTWGGPVCVRVCVWKRGVLETVDARLRDMEPWARGHRLSIVIGGGCGSWWYA